MLPLVRLNRLAFRAASLASNRLDEITNGSNNPSTSSNNKNTIDRQHTENISIIKNIEQLEAAFQQDEKRNGPSRNLTEIFDKLRTLKLEKKNSNSVQDSTEDNSSSSFLQQQHQEESIFLASFTNSIILQFYNLGVTDRTLWLQLKSLALRVSAYSSSLAVVTNLECLARKSVCGPLECKSFQLQLTSTDLSALPATEVLRLVAACQLCGAPLQQNVKNVVIAQGLSWIEGASGGLANCSMWWVLADVLDQLPSQVRKSLAFNLIFAVEKIRSSSITINQEHQGNQNNNYDDAKLRLLWPQHDKDTTFIMWRLRTNSSLSLTKGSEVPAEFNPPFSDVLLNTIRVDKLPTARSCLLLLRALCSGTEDLSPPALAVTEDCCRVIYNNVIESKITSRFVIRTIIHSIAGSEQVRTKVPTAPLLGIEASHHYLRHHSHYITNEATCSIIKLVIAAEKVVVKNKSDDQVLLRQDEKTAIVQVIDQVKKKLEQTMRRLILISSSNTNLNELLSLASEIGILELSSAEFALDLMQTQKANPHEIGKVASIVEKLKKQKASNKNGEVEKSEATNKIITTTSSLISNWSEIRSLSSPRIAFYAVNAAKQMFENTESISNNTAISSVVAPISNIISSSSTTSATTGNTSINSNNSSSSTSLSTSLFSLSSAQSEVVTHHKGLRALAAADCATLVGATTVLPSEAKSLVLRMTPNEVFFDNNNPSSSSNIHHQTTPRIRLRVKKQQQQHQHQQNQKDDGTTTSSSSLDSQNQNQHHQHHPLFEELQSCVTFLEAQSSINTCLEINSGADFAIFTSAQRRITRFFQLASYPPPFEFAENPTWVSWCGRLVCAMALHRLATIKLPLWLMNVFVEKYCFSFGDARNQNNNNNSNSLEVFRAIRTLHACCYFGFADTKNLKITQGGIMKAFSSSTQSLVSPKGLLQILRSLPHLVSSRRYLREFDDNSAKPQVEMWLQEFSTKLAELSTKEKEKKQENEQQEPKSDIKIPATATAASSSSSSSSSTKTVSALQNPNLYKGGFGSSSSSSSSSSSVSVENLQHSYFTASEKRKLFYVLCCAAQLDLPPNQFKHLIEHLHPFDTSMYPLADSMFFFGHAAQKKRLSGFSLRVWRTLTMQLDKVTMINGPSSSPSAATDNSASSFLLNSLSSSGISETLTSNNNLLFLLSGSNQNQQLLHHGSASTGSRGCGLPLVQTSMLVPPILLSLAYYISFGGGSSTIDSLIEKLRRFAPFEPLLLAKVIRIALAPSGLKTRPVLSQFVCRSFDSTTAQSLSTNDLIMIMEVFSSNQAQRVTVGLIQADAMVALCWEVLFARIDSLPDDLFLRAAGVTCFPSSLNQSGLVTKIIKRLLEIAKKDIDDFNKNNNNAPGSSSSVDAPVPPPFVPVVVRERHIWTPIIFQHVVSHVANVRDYHAKWSSSSSASSSSSNESSSKSPYDYYIKRNADGSLVKKEGDEDPAATPISTFFEDGHDLENAAELWEQIKDNLLEPLQPYLKGADKEAMEELLSM